MRGGGEHRGGREVARERARRRPGGGEHRVVDVGRGDEPARARRAGRSGQRRGEPLSAVTRPRAPSARLAPSRGDRRVGHDERADRRRPEPGGGAHADQPPRAERDQLRDHRRRARPAEPGALDRQRRAVRGRPAVAPEPAVVVEHARSVDQLLREPERAAGVAGQQHALRDRLVRLEDRGRVGHGRRPFKLGSRGHGEKGLKEEEGPKRTTRPPAPSRPSTPSAPRSSARSRPPRRRRSRCAVPRRSSRVISRRRPTGSATCSNRACWPS